ncbi:MAG: NAD(P)H-dependent oxidoreductase subunit E [Spirochaetaceae bacterium]|jgi:NADH:ubiquinone oxidoreductase subunit E|nr:NAD(P)H-dependent oxidoreductase subunit E [Spirochaetaceae bacterium]
MQENSSSATKESVCEASEKELLESLSAVIQTLSKEKGGLIPALQTAQNLFGYLPETALSLISTELSIPLSEVTGVVSFYSFFTTTPRGKHLVRICLGTACYVRGGKDVLKEISKILDINVGETTEDRKFSLEVGRCYGACGLAPVMMVDDEVFQRVNPTKIKDIISNYAREVEL